MGVSFYQFWLPVSLGLHVVLALALATVRLPDAATPPPEQFTLVTDFSTNLPTETPPAVRATTHPARVIPRTLIARPDRPVPMTLRPAATAIGVPAPLAPSNPAPSGPAESSPPSGPLSVAMAPVPGVPARGPGRGGAPGLGSPNAATSPAWRGSGSSDATPSLPGSAPGLMTSARGSWAAPAGEAGGHGRSGGGGWGTHLTPSRAAGPGRDRDVLDARPSGTVEIASALRPGTPGGPAGGAGTGAGHPRASLSPLAPTGGGGTGTGPDVPPVPAGVPGGGKRAPGDWTDHPGGAGGSGPGGAGPGGTGHDSRFSCGASIIGTATAGYPTLAVAEHLAGTVHVTVSIDTQGNPIELRVDKRSNADVLDNAARRAARSWQYKPAMKNGMPVAGTLRWKFVFTADGKVNVSPL